MLTTGIDGTKPQLYRGTWDGDWEAVDLPALTKEGFAELASTPDGVVLGATGTAVWFTADGTDWRIVAEPEDILRMNDTRTGPYTVPELFLSTDGKTWCSLGRPGSGKDATYEVAPLADGRLLAIGARQAENETGLRLIAFVADAPVCVPLDASDPSNTESSTPTESPAAS